MRESETMKPSADLSGGNRKKKPALGRLEYLDQLVVEFQTTKSEDAREQVLANLVNFAYDPRNYEYFRELNILDLFLDHLSSSDLTLLKYSIGGLCNLCLDPINKNYIIQNGLGKIIELLENSNEDVILSAITTLMFLITPESKPEITSEKVVKFVVKMSKEENSRIKNLATMFLEDYCDKEKVLLESESVKESSEVLNLPSGT